MSPTVIGILGTVLFIALIASSVAGQILMWDRNYRKSRQPAPPLEEKLPLTADR